MIARMVIRAKISRVLGDKVHRLPGGTLIGFGNTSRRARDRMACAALMLCAALTFALSTAQAQQPPTFTSGLPPAGFWHVPYSFTLRALGSPPPLFTVLPNASVLPPGLTLNVATGVLSGTPTYAGFFNGLFMANNAVGAPAIQPFTILIATNQGINFPAFPNRPLDSPPFTVAATATSSLPVTFSAATLSVCTVSGNIVTLVATGTCTIRASQAGNAVYSNAFDVNQSFTVTAPGAPISQTISFGPLGSKPFNSPPFTLSATASSGLAVSFSSLTTAICTVSGSTVTLIAVGTCTIRAAQAGNTAYAPAPNVDQSFTVTAPIAQTISFEALSNVPFGSQPFNVTAMASSGLPVSFASLTTGVCIVDGNTVTVIVIGTCTVRASQAGDATHAAAPNVDRSFSVTVASQTISFLPISNRPLDVLPIELRATASSGLPVNFASQAPTVCRVNDNWVTLLIAGMCTIRASQPGSASYSAALSVDQSFTVTPAGQTLLFPQPAMQALSHPQFLPGATASSGLPVTFTSLTPAVCTASGSVVTLVAAGTCTIRATQAGNTSYVAVSADRSFSVVSGGVPGPTVPLPGPFIEYSTLLGGYGADGFGYDKAFDVVVSPDGSAWVGGSVAGTYFPGLSSATFTNGGLDLLYVAKLNPNRGQVDVATVVGARAAGVTGSGRYAYVGAGQVEAMAISPSGTIYVAAYANSVTYPLTGGTYLRTGPKTIYRIGSDASVQALAAVVDPAVTTIRALALDSAGAIYITGVAGPGLATTVNAAISAASAPAGGPYLIKFAPGGVGVAYATYLSVRGSRASIAPDADQSPIDNATTAYALTIDSAGNAYLAGQAKANDFPVTAGAPDTFDDQNRDAFVAKVNPAGTAMLWVARLGGRDADRATSIALAPDGSIVIGGKTANNSLNSFFGFQSRVQFLHANEIETGFIAKLAADASRWIFVAPVGSAGGNLVRDAFDNDPSPIKVAVDAVGAIYASGTSATDRVLPVVFFTVPRLARQDWWPIQSPGYYDDGSAALINGPDAVFAATGSFLMKLTADGGLFYSVVVNQGRATGLAIDAFGAAYVAGYQAGPPQVNAAQAAPGSVFVAKIIGQSAPVILTTTPNPCPASQSVTLTASVGDARYDGSIEFRDGAQVLATVPAVGGTATFTTTFAIGIHRLAATFHGSGPFDGAVAPEVVQVINQAGP
jgi:Bacterial Ig-like domain (group 3)/Beta-propeller repeat